MNLAAPTLSAYTCTLDALGHRAAVSETLRQPDSTLQTTAITYTYNALYRLTNATYSTGSVFTYTYDAVGNRLTQTVVTATTVYTYEAANRLTNVGAIPYTWDANGYLRNELRYAPWAKTRLASGTTPTTYRFTGQRQDWFIIASNCCRCRSS